MLKDNYAEYDRNKSRGTPREGAALLHGLVYCGECGHKMVVQYKGGTRYLCNYLRQQHGVAVCQYLPADPVDARVVEAFFAALSPVELDAYAHAVKLQQRGQEAVDAAYRQRLKRLRYQAALAQRQYNRVDPDNRLVAAELERRWERALSELKRAEEAHQSREASAILEPIPGELEEAFRYLGPKLPQVWNSGLLPRSSKKAFLRCLIDKVVVHRRCRDELATRIVWRGGETTPFTIPIPVGSFKELSFAEEMERGIVEMSQAGILDEQIAEELTRQGYRSPLRGHVLPSTVKTIRLKHRIMQKRSQSHPRRFAGFLTVPQLARQLGVAPHWLYDRIYKGCIEIEKEARSGCYLFPDTPATTAKLKALEQGQLERVCFSDLAASSEPLDS
jgi:hypothetical protein